MRPFDLLVDTADLVLGRCCQVCGAIGPEVCARCLVGLRIGPRSIAVRTGGPGPSTAVVATDYEGAVRHPVLAYKEDGHRGLARPLGTLLADAIACLALQDPITACSVVPIPGHRHSRRGFDALDGLVVRAQRDLAQRGIPVRIVRLLRTRSDYRPAKTLGRVDRQRSLDGAFQARAPRAPLRRLIVVDDVITTGTTITEGVRALAVCGLPVHGVAAIAAVR